MRAWATVLAWLFGPPSVAALAIVLGDLGELGWPPPPQRWGPWLDAGDPAIAVVATLRLALVLACVLASLRVCGAIIEMVRLGPSVPGPATIGAPRSLRWALQRITRPALALGLGVSLVSSSTAAAASTSTIPAVDRHPGLDAGAAGIDAALQVDERLADESAPTGSVAELRRVRIEIAPLPGVAVAAASSDVWVVAPGDHLWGIASQTLADHFGDEPSPRRVHRYWRRLIEANEERFVIPGEPDVIWPGQRLTLPQLGTPANQRSGT